MGHGVGSPGSPAAAEQRGGKDAPFTPGAMLTFFTAINVLVYYDRGVLSSVLDILEREDQLGLNGLQQGLLGNSFMLGFVAASPVFARMSATMNPLRIMAIGLGVWTYATALCGLAPNFYFLFFARALTGVGEASFVSLAPPMIDKMSDPKKRSQSLAVFFTAIPVGLALGFGIASFWAGDKKSTDDSGAFGLTNKEWGWRSAFLAESLIMLPFVLVCATREGRVVFEDDVAEKDKPPRDLKSELLQLWHNPLYVCVVLGYSAQTFVSGGLAFFGKSYVVSALGYKDGEAGALFGGTTAMMGLVGTAFGGFFVDRLRNAKPEALAPSALDDLTVAAAGGNNEEAKNDHNLVLVTSVVLIFSTLCWPAGVMAFVIAGYHRGLFFLFLAIAEFFLFAALTPINSALLWSTPYALNPLALAMSVVVTHMLGDALSPVLIGELHDQTQNWTETMVIASSWLVFSVIFFAMALFYAKRRAQKHGVVLTQGELLLFDAEVDDRSTSLLGGGSSD